MKLESDKLVVCDGSCSECPRCLMLYICDAVDCGGISAWRTWLGSRIALPNSSSSAMLHSSDNWHYLHVLYIQKSKNITIIKTADK